MDVAQQTSTLSTPEDGSQAAGIGTITNVEKRYTTHKVEQCGLEWEVAHQDLVGLVGVVNKIVANRSHPQEDRVWIPSPRFQAGKLIGRAADWCIQLTHAVDEAGVGYLSSYLWLLGFHNDIEGNESGESEGDEKSPQHIDIIYRLQLLKNGTMIISKESAIRRFRACVEDSIWGWMRFLPISELLAHTGPNVKLTIRLNMTILQKEEEPCVDSYTDCTSEAEVEVNISARSSSSGLSFLSETTGHMYNEDEMSPPMNNSQALSEHVENENVVKLKSMIASLWDSKEGCDAEVKSGDKVFKVHANILSARSNFFRRLFSDPNQGKTFVADGYVNEKDMEAILKHCYTGELNIEKNFENYVELYKAAFTLEMRILIEEIFVELSSPRWLVSTGTAMILLRLGQQYPPTTSALKNLSKYFTHHLDDMEQLKEYTKFRDAEWVNAEELLSKLLCDV